MKKIICCIMVMFMIFSSTLSVSAACTCEPATSSTVPFQGAGHRVDFVDELGMFVAVGEYGLITSVDGVDWTYRSHSGAGWNYCDFAYGNDKMILLEPKDYSQRIFVLDKYLNSSQIAWTRCGTNQLSLKPMIIYDDYTGYFYAGGIEYDITAGTAKVARMGMYRTKGVIGAETGKYMASNNSFSVTGTDAGSVSVMQWEFVNFGASDVYYEFNDWFSKNSKTDLTVPDNIYKEIAVDGQGRLIATPGTVWARPYRSTWEGWNITAIDSVWNNNTFLGDYTLLAKFDADGNVNKSKRHSAVILSSVEFDKYGYCYYSSRRGTSGADMQIDSDSYFHFDSALNDASNIATSATKYNWVQYSSDGTVSAQKTKIYPAGYGTTSSVGETDYSLHHRHKVYNQCDGDLAVYSKQYDKMIFVPVMSRETGYVGTSSSNLVAGTINASYVYDNDIRIMSYKDGGIVDGNKTLNYINDPEGLYTLFRNGYVDSTGARYKSFTPVANTSSDYTKSNHVSSVATGNGKLVIFLGKGLFSEFNETITKPGKIYTVDISDIANMNTNIDVNNTTVRSDKISEANIKFQDNAIKFTNNSITLFPGDEYNLRDLVKVYGGDLTSANKVCTVAPVAFSVTDSAVNDDALDGLDLDFVSDSGVLYAFDEAEFGRTYTVELKAECENSPSVYTVAQIKVTYTPAKDVVINGTAANIGLGSEIPGLVNGENIIKVQYNEAFYKPENGILLCVALYHGDILENVQTYTYPDVAAGEKLTGVQFKVNIPTDAVLSEYRAKLFLWDLSTLKPL